MDAARRFLRRLWTLAPTAAPAAGCSTAGTEPHSLLNDYDPQEVRAKSAAAYLARQAAAARPQAPDGPPCDR